MRGGPIPPGGTIRGRVSVSPVGHGRPADRDARLLADRPAVVAGRHLENVARAVLDRAAVRQRDTPPTRDRDPDVPILAPVAAKRRPGGARPSPPRLRPPAPDPDPADLDHLFSQQGQLGHLARVREVLPEELHRLEDGGARYA